MTGDHGNDAPSSRYDASFLAQEDPAAIVMQQDACYAPDGLDIARWSETVFFPLLIVFERGQILVENQAALETHLNQLFETGRKVGMHALRTRVQSSIRPSEDTAIIRSMRDRLDRHGDLLGSVSVTWQLIRSDGQWKITQIYFNDSRGDPSLVAQTISNPGDLND